MATANNMFECVAHHGKWECRPTGNGVFVILDLLFMLILAMIWVKFVLVAKK